MVHALKPMATVLASMAPVATVLASLPQQRSSAVALHHLLS